MTAKVEGKTHQELRREAKELGYAGKSNPTKAELIDYIDSVTMLKAAVEAEAAKALTVTIPANRNRHLKMECPSCKYIARAARRTMERFGMPTCSCGTKFVRVEP